MGAMSRSKRTRLSSSMPISELVARLDPRRRKMFALARRS